MSDFTFPHVCNTGNTLFSATFWDFTHFVNSNNYRKCVSAFCANINQMLLHVNYTFLLHWGSYFIKTPLAKSLHQIIKEYIHTQLHEVGMMQWKHFKNARNSLRKSEILTHTSGTKTTIEPDTVTEGLLWGSKCQLMTITPCWHWFTYCFDLLFQNRGNNREKRSSFNITVSICSQRHLHLMGVFQNLLFNVSFFAN